MLAGTSRAPSRAEMVDVRKRLEADDDRALAEWLRSCKPDDETAFLLAIDQFEELFTFADPAERGRFDCLLATALNDAECPLFVISTVRADFLDRFDDLPRLDDGAQPGRQAMDAAADLGRRAARGHSRPGPARGST